MTKHVRLEVARRFEALPVDRRAWNELALRSETSTVFQTYEWFSSWCQVFGDQSQLCLIFVFVDEALAGIVPLASKRRTIRFATETHADYCDIIAADHKKTVLRATLTYLMEQQADWESISLYNIPESSSTVALLQAVTPQTRLRLLIRGTAACPAVVLDRVPGGAQTLLRKDSLQRPYTHFLRDGELGFRNITDFEEATALLPQLFAQHIERWRREKSPSLFLKHDNQRFYGELIRQMLPTGWLVFSVVEHERRPVAFHIGFSFADTFLWYKPSFEFRLRKQSPGNVMLRFLLQQAIEQGKKEFDFTVGDEAFKRRYSNVVRYNTNVLLTSRIAPYAMARARLMARQLLHRLLGNRT